MGTICEMEKKPYTSVLSRLPEQTMRPSLSELQHARRKEYRARKAEPTVETTDGRQFPRNEFSDDDRSTGEWAAICGISVETFRNRMSQKKGGKTWRIGRLPNGRYIVHVDDLPADVRGSKRVRDDKLKQVES